MIVATNVFMLADLALQKAVGGTLNGVILHLFSNDITPNRDAVLADFTEANFNGYAASSAIVWGTPFLDTNDVPTMLSPLKSFIMGSGSPANAQVVYGYYVTDSPATEVLLCERFSVPVNMASAGNQINVVVQVQAVSQTG